MVSQPKSSKQSPILFDLIPEDIIESWLKGEYLLGTSRNAGYDYIGWSLFVRGFYHYQVRLFDLDARGKPRRKVTNPHSRGFCLIDLIDGEISLKGIRTNLYKDVGDGKYEATTESKDAPAVGENGHAETRYERPGFFRSEFSKLIISQERPADEATLYFGYRFYTVPQKPDPNLDNICKEKRSICEAARRHYEEAENEAWATLNTLGDALWPDPAVGQTSPDEAALLAEEQLKFSLYPYYAKVYDYLTNSTLFDSHFAQMRDKYRKYDEEMHRLLQENEKNGEDEAIETRLATDDRNLYAIVQLPLSMKPRGVKAGSEPGEMDYRRLPFRATFDKILGPFDKNLDPDHDGGYQKGQTTFTPITMLEMAEHINAIERKAKDKARQAKIERGAAARNEGGRA